MAVPNQVVIFGASGDLTSRKLIPALASLAAKRRPEAGFTVMGCARRPKTDEQWRSELRELMPAELRADFDRLAPDIHYLPVDAGSAGDLQKLSAALDALPGGAHAGRLFYLSLKPELFGPTVQSLSQAGLLKQLINENQAYRRVVIEKPFGHDLQSATELNRALHAHLHEDQIYRIDHYLGKETVQNLLGLRFHNAIFEPLWNRHHVELVQITVAEDLGMEQGRGGYYDTTGALRDMMQNHMLQVLSFIAMEPPSSLEPAEIRNKKVAVLRAVHPPPLEDAARHEVRAQYTAGQLGGRSVPGYLEEEGVDAESQTENYVAVRAEIDTWRWSGVPFFLRHGKRLPKKFTEISIQFRTAPLQLFNKPEGLTDEEFRRQLREGTLCQLRPNVLTLSIQPREQISLSFGVKRPGNSMTMEPVDMTFDYKDRFGNGSAPAYERLLLEAMLGDPTLFISSDEIDASWRFADKLMGHWASDQGPKLITYPAGTWGPSDADELFRGCEGGWSTGARATGK